MLKHILKFALVGVAVYLLIAGGLLLWPPPGPRGVTGQATTQLDNFVQGKPLAQPAPESFFVARDGKRRLFRRYDGAGEDVLIMLHGSASDTRYLAGLSRTLTELLPLTVLTLDMRGHGPRAENRGDVAHVGQQEWDIADLIARLRAEKPTGRFLLGGHSMGGGLAIRYGAGTELPRPDRLILLAPYVDRNAPSSRTGTGGWATPFVTRFAGIEMLQRVGVHAFDGLTVLRFEMPPKARDGNETLHYSWRMLKSISPREDWKGDIARIASPVLVLAAENDPIFVPEGYREVFRPLKHAEVDVLPKVNHFELAISEETARRIADWLKRRK